MKQFAILMFMIGFYCAPVSAQNSGQIALVQDGKSCAGCNLFQADLSYRDGKKMDLSEARLRQANLSLATYDDVNFSGANLSVSNLFGARCNRANMTQTNLENAIAVGTYFGSSDLTGASIVGTNFSGAELRITQGLNQAQLDRACGDPTTRLPKGLQIPACVSPR